MKLFMARDPFRSAVAKRRGKSGPKLLFGKLDPQQRRADKVWEPDAVEAWLGGEDDRALCLRAEKEGKL